MCGMKGECYAMFCAQSLRLITVLALQEPSTFSVNHDTVNALVDFP